MTNIGKLLSDLISEFETSLSTWKGKPNVLLPSSIQFYRLGLVLADQIDSEQAEEKNPGEFQQVYQSLMGGFPMSHLRGVLEDLHEAFHKTLENFEAVPDAESQCDIPSLKLAVQSMYGLYATDSNTLLAAAATHPVAGWSMSKVQLVDSVYQKQKRCLKSQESSTGRLGGQLLSLLSSFLEETTLDYEHLLPAINHLQEIKYKHETSTWEDLVRLKAAKDPSWKEALVGRFTETTQQGYILSMFALEEDEDNAAAPSQQDKSKTKSSTQKKATTKTESPADTVQRLVQQVRAVFPHLGEGYVETALSNFRGDVERTMSALVEGQSNPSSLPVVLQRLDPSLPARWKGSSSKQSKEEEEEARRITHEQVRVMEGKQEAEARALEVMIPTGHDEYDDDYDDQYDDIDGFISRDSGLYDDFDTVRTYNKMMKQVEEEQAFWEGNRNENRSQRRSSKTKKEDGCDNNEQKYRGPDKIKGGRVPKPAQDSDSNTDANSNDGSQSRGGDERGGSGRGRGGGHQGGRGRGRGRGGGRGGGGNDQSGNNNNNKGSGGGGRGKARHKQNKLASRRDKQKQANAKRSG